MSKSTEKKIATVKGNLMIASIYFVQSEKPYVSARLGTGQHKYLFAVKDEAEFQIIKNGSGK